MMTYADVMKMIKGSKIQDASHPRVHPFTCEIKCLCSIYNKDKDKDKDYNNKEILIDSDMSLLGSQLSQVNPLTIMLFIKYPKWQLSAQSYI